VDHNAYLKKPFPLRFGAAFSQHQELIVQGPTEAREHISPSIMRFGQLLPLLLISLCDFDQE
jgi:hypothetical protein